MQIGFHLANRRHVVVRTFALVAGCLLLVGCNEEQPTETSNFVRESCRRAQRDQCEQSCAGQDGRFSECYIDPRYVKGSVGWRECFAIRVGNKCPPCKQLFSINGAGAFRSVSCEYFYSAIELRNKQCKNCLQRAPKVDFSDNDLP